MSRLLIRNAAAITLDDQDRDVQKGQIVDTLPADQATKEQLGLLMAGVTSEQ